jgi:outer membrane protein TolC
MRFRIGKMERLIEMAEIMILPGYSLNFSLYADEAVRQAGSQAAKETFMTSTTAAVGAGLPKSPWYGTRDAYLSETRKKLTAMRYELKDAEAETATTVRLAWYELDRSMREWRLYETEVVPLSQAALDASTSGYEAGDVTFADVIGSYTLWLDAHLASERRRADAGVALAELQRTVGTMRISAAASETKKRNEGADE